MEAKIDTYTQHGQTGYNMSVNLYNTCGFKGARKKLSRRGKCRTTRGDGESLQSKGTQG